MKRTYLNKKSRIVTKFSDIEKIKSINMINKPMKKHLFFLIGMVFYITIGFNVLNSTPSSLKHSAQFSTLKIAAKNEYKIEINRTWGGIDDDWGSDITLDASRNIFITGLTTNFGSDAFIAKIDSTGNSLLNITWDNSGSDLGNGIALDASDNIFITGLTINSFIDASIAKFNSSGNSLLNITWGGSDIDDGSGIMLDALGNIFITGSTYSYGAGICDAFIAKFNSTGDLQWNITWGGGSADRGYEIVSDASGNIYMVGYTESFGAGGLDALIAKFNSTGDLQWNITWGGSGDEYGMGLKLDASGNIFITGITNSSGAGSDDAFIAKFNTAGIEQWNITWGGSNEEFGLEIVLGASGNIFITGLTNSSGAGVDDVFIAKFNSIGVLQWNITWGGSNKDQGLGIKLDASENIFITGLTNSFGAGNSDAFILKYKFFPDQGPGNTDPPDVISGFNLLFLIGFIGLILILLTKKQYKNLN